MKLVITADDLGYCPRRDAGIFSLFSVGGITQASLLVGAPYAAAACQSALSDGLPLGLHFNVTEGPPVASADGVKSLLGEDGAFLGKMGFRNALDNGAIALSEIMIEFVAQWRLFVTLTSTAPTYLDSHQHIHVEPGVIKAIRLGLEQLGCGDQLLWCRIPLDLMLLESPDYDSPAAPFKFLKRVNNGASNFDWKGFRRTDHFIGNSCMGPLMTRLPSFLTEMKEFMRADGTGTVEVMCHPGYRSKPGDGGFPPAGPDEFSLSKDRLEELETLFSFAKQNELAKLGFELASYQNM